MTMKLLKDLVDIRTGYPFRGRPERAATAGIRLVQMRDVQPDQPWVSAELERVEAPANWEKHRLRMTDIVMTSRGERNNAAEFSSDPKISNDDDDAPDELPAVAASQMLVLRPRRVGDTLLPAYLVWYLNRPETQAQLKSMRTGSNIPFLPVEALKSLEVPLPSYQMQQHITHLHQLSMDEQRLMTQIQDKRRELMAGVFQCLLTNQTTA